MNRRDLVLAAMATDVNTEFTPVQVQKLFFLIDRNISNFVGGPHFDFRAHDYGPFDAAVYHEIEALAASGDAVVNENPQTRFRTYQLTANGKSRGREILSGLPRNVCRYVTELVAWIRSLSFNELVSAIYGQYPEMKERSVFTGEDHE